LSGREEGGGDMDKICPICWGAITDWQEYTRQTIRFNGNLFHRICVELKYRIFWKENGRNGGSK